MNFEKLIEDAAKTGASDIFLIPEKPVAYKLRREIRELPGSLLSQNDAAGLLDYIFAAAGRSQESFRKTGDDDFAVNLNCGRFRVSALKQMGKPSAVIRPVSAAVPDYRAMGIPEAVLDTAKYQKGLVLVTGPAGSGKSTTLACIMDRFNHQSQKHIITIEDPVEFIYENDKCLFTQRELGTDTESYAGGLRACLRQAPDVIMVGEMRDYDTIKTALTAAETGHLVFSTLHTLGISSTVNRIIDIFPPDQQQQIRVQLASQLQTAITQELIRTVDGELVPVFEVVQLTAAMKNMIRENKTHQLDSSLGIYSSDGSMNLDHQLTELYKAGKITLEAAMNAAIRPDLLKKRIEDGFEIG